ncbi:RNA-directed DNA polymerase, eukaryota, reverse transcriptase zinc-binding domain protein [Tanacetum coccineum]|uniref:RNA-directed DNA polymerase, eukaryota, reverse transcriptase zinc-binding domain protein n=1 Tax=Tanacetum coccineum TaxID=301880 RepID=A0ABQ4WBI8_9ASTR
MGVWENTSWVRSIAVFINGEIRLFAAFIFKSRMLIFAVSSSGSGILRNGVMGYLVAVLVLILFMVLEGLKGHVITWFLVLWYSTKLICAQRIQGSGIIFDQHAQRFKEVIDVPVPVLDHDRDDITLWFDKQNVEVRFSVKEAWRVLGPDVPKVLRHKHVWFSQCIPRHAFILWMAIKGRLKTQDRISRWFSADNMVCPFCKSCKDSHSHLFFQCGFAQGVWERLKSMNRLEDLSCVWAEIISGISIRKANNTLWSIIQRLVLGAAVYFIWRERNFRFCEVGWGGLGYLFWVGVIRECRVDYSYVMVMMLRVRWLVFSLFGKHSFLNNFYGLTWSHMFSMENEGIRVMWIWSDKGHSFWPPLYDNRYCFFSPWEGCKPSLDASWDWVQVISCCHACLSYLVLKVICLTEWVRFSLCVFGGTPSMLERLRMLNFGICIFLYLIMIWFDSLKGVWVNTSRVRIIATFINGVIRLCCCTLFISSGGLAAAGGSIFLVFWLLKDIQFSCSGQVWFSYGSSLGCSGLGLSKDSGTGFEKLIQISIVFRMSSSDSDMFRWNVDGSISMILLVYFHDHILGNLNMGQFKVTVNLVYIWEEAPSMSLGRGTPYVFGKRHPVGPWEGAPSRTLGKGTHMVTTHNNMNCG